MGAHLLWISLPSVFFVAGLVLFALSANKRVNARYGIPASMIFLLVYYVWEFQIQVERHHRWAALGQIFLCAVMGRLALLAWHTSKQERCAVE